MENGVRQMKVILGALHLKIPNSMLNWILP